jgi:hypothetical protein
MYHHQASTWIPFLRVLEAYMRSSKRSSPTRLSPPLSAKGKSMTHDGLALPRATRSKKNLPLAEVAKAPRRPVMLVPFVRHLARRACVSGANALKRRADYVLFFRYNNKELPARLLLLRRLSLVQHGLAVSKNIRCFAASQRCAPTPSTSLRSWLSCSRFAFARSNSSCENTPRWRPVAPFRRAIQSLHIYRKQFPSRGKKRKSTPP